MVDALSNQIHLEVETLITGEDLAEMGDIGRNELVEGRIITMSPTGWQHGKYESLFDYYLKSFVIEQNLGDVLVGEVGLYTQRDPDTVRGADVIFISNERLGKVKSASFLDVAPELIIEITSPDDRWNRVKQKLNEYFDTGVDVVWIVDPSDKTVSVYRSLTNVDILTANDTLTCEDILPGFSLSLASIFSE